MSKPTFFAIDFETATHLRASACEVGITRVDDGHICLPESWLIQPDGNRFDTINSIIHGIRPADTAEAPGFADVWPTVAEKLKGQTVVAHYAPFDMGVIRDECQRCGLPLPEFRFVDSCYLARIVCPGLLSYSIEPLCDYLGISVIGHHRAADDAVMAAKILLELCERAEVATVDELVEKCRYRFGIFAGGQYRPFHRLPDPSGKFDLDAFARDYEATGDDFNEGNPFYNKEVVFTGKMEYERRDLMQMVMDVGGRTKESVTKTTDFLVVGTQDLRVVGSSGLSGKQKKAMQMIEKGHHIAVITEADFCQMMGNDLKPLVPSLGDVAKAFSILMDSDFELS